MPELMNTREAARYLGINEKKVYFLAKTGKDSLHQGYREVDFPKEID